MKVFEYTNKYDVVCEVKIGFSKIFAPIPQLEGLQFPFIMSLFWLYFYFIIWKKP